LNGFTDAPNAISSVVGTGALKMWQACSLCAVFNFLGAILSYMINSSVADSVFSLASFGENTKIGVLAALISVIVFTVFAWLFSMPSSESHALISSILGASLALSKSFNGSHEIFKVLIFACVSSLVAFITANLFGNIFKKKSLPYGKLQIVGASLSSFIHGAQDGQKFVALLMLFYSQSRMNDTSARIYPVLTVSFAISAGALLGGGRIIKTLGEKTAKLNKRTGFVADLSSSLSCLAFSMLGAPISTSNVKALALMGVAHSEKEKVNKRTARALLLTSLLTFPVCFLLSYIIAKLLLMK
jgi:PiT family inorganic phosphate transporter